MKFCLGKPPDDLDVVPASPEWNRIKNPIDLDNPKTVLAYGSLSVLIVAVGLVAWVFLSANPWDGDFDRMFPPEKLALYFVLTVVVHEVIHVLAQPFFGFSERTIVGCLRKPIVPYVVYCGVLTRTRVLVILLAPLMALSVVPLLSILIPGFGGGEIAVVAILNAAFSVGDARNSLEILRRIPGDSIVASHAGVAWWAPTKGASGKVASGRACP